MREIILLVEEAPEGGYTAQALGYSIYTEADTWEELKLAAQDAVLCHFTIPHHSPLRVGTLNAIPRDVAQHLEIDRDTLIASLFGK